MSSTKVRIFSTTSRQAMQRANDSAVAANLPSILPENLLLGLMRSPQGGMRIFLESLLPVDELCARIVASFSRNSGQSGNQGASLPLSPELRKICLAAEHEAKDAGHTEIQPEDLLLAISQFPNQSAGMYLSFYGLTRDNLKAEIAANEAKAVSAAPTPAPAAVPAQTPTPAPTAKVSCKSGCGCAATKQSATPEDQAIKALMQALGQSTSNGVDAELVEWFKVLQEAIMISKQTGMAVPAAFVQATIMSQTVYNKEAKAQIRQEALHDAIERVLALAH